MNLSAINNATQGKVKTTGVSPFLELELDKVYPNPNQPRKSFEDLEELAASIKTNGLIQPIAVVSDGAGKYMIISGERRYRASELNKARTIKAHIIKADSSQVEELALVENIQRSDLTDLEVAKYISILWGSGKYKKKSDLAAAIGKSPSYISKAFSCLKLDSSILEDLEESKHDVPLTVLEEISRVKDKDTQKEVYDKYVAGEIVRDDIKSFKSSAKSEEISLGKKQSKKRVIKCCGHKNSKNEPLTFYMPNNGDHQKLNGYLEIDGVKDFKTYIITIEEL